MRKNLLKLDDNNIINIDFITGIYIDESNYCLIIEYLNFYKRRFSGSSICKCFLWEYLNLEEEESFSELENDDCTHSAYKNDVSLRIDKYIKNYSNLSDLKRDYDVLKEKLRLYYINNMMIL